MYICSFYLYMKTLRSMQLISPFYRWSNWQREINLLAQGHMVAKKGVVTPAVWFPFVYLNSNLFKIFLFCKEKNSPLQRHWLYISMFIFFKTLWENKNWIKLKTPIQWVSNGYIFWYPPNSTPSFFFLKFK